MTRIPPDGIDETAISPAFLSQVLHRPIESVEAERIGADRGFAGVVLALTLHQEQTRLAKNLPLRLAAKVSGPAGAEIHLQLLRETLFYQSWAEERGAPTPRCWFAGSSPAELPVLLLEDLSDARPGDAIAGATPDDVHAVLLAMLPIWQLRDHPRPRSWPRSVQHGDAERRRQWHYSDQWRAQRDRWEQQLPAEVWQLGEQLINRLAEVLVALNPTIKAIPTALLHGDLHLDNVLFAPNGPVVLDWATFRDGYPAQDVFPFVATSLDADETVARSLISEAGQRIHGVDTAAYNRFIDDGKRALLAHFAGLIGWHGRPVGEHHRERALRDAALGNGRLCAALINWDAGAVLR